MLLGLIATHRFPDSIRRYGDWLRRFRTAACISDAVCSFNPTWTYG